MNFNINSGSGFNSFDGMSSLSSKIIDYLIENNEDIWKLLYYNTSDALSMDDIPNNVKASMVYIGEGSAEEHKVFTYKFVDDMFLEQTSQLRIYIDYITPQDRSKALVDMCFQVLVHPKIETLSNRASRSERISEEIFKTLNGVYIKSIVGNIFFDANTSRYNSYKVLNYNNRNFAGPSFIMSLWYSHVKE